MNYINKYGLYDVKPNTDGEPTGNDGWILTAYAKKLGARTSAVQIEKARETWFQLEWRDGLPVERLPGKETPPPSRDMFLGAAYLNLLTAGSGSGWNFSPVPLPPFSPLKTLASFILAHGEHRNYLWQKEMTHAYRFMFSVPLADRAFYFRCKGKKAPVIYRLIEWADKKRNPHNNSSALIRWLKYDQYPGIQVFEEYFGVDHPITKAARIWANT